MAKDSFRGCPDCASPDLSKLWGNKGDGRCSKCRGDGRQTDIVRALAGPVLGFDTDEPCSMCHGTGQCQTCGGTGYEYYNESDSDQYSSDNNSDNTDSAYSSQYDSYYDDYSYSPSSTSSDSDTGSSWGGIILLVIIIAIGSAVYKKCSKNDLNSNLPPRPRQEEVVVPVVPECESNTGSYSFKNTTSRMIYVFLKRGEIWWTTIKVEPKQTAYEYDLVADEYSYNYGYHEHEIFNQNNATGTFLVEKCKTGNLNLKLPAFKWYKINGDDWTEVKIPAGGNYIIMAPRVSFMFRFPGDDRVYGTNSSFIIPDSIRTIYVQHGFVSEAEICIEKYYPDK